MSHNRVLLMLNCEIERQAIVDRLRSETPDVDVWLLDETGGFVPADPCTCDRIAQHAEANLVVCDLSRPEQTCGISAAVLRTLLVHSRKLSILCLLPDNRMHLLTPTEHESSLEGIVDVIRRTSVRKYPVDLTAYPFHFSSIS